MTAHLGSVAGRELAAPFPEGIGTDSTGPDRSFDTTTAGVEGIHAGSASIIVHYDQQRIVIKFQFLKVTPQSAQVFIDIGDLTVERRAVPLALKFRFISFVRFAVFRRNLMGRVRRVSGQVEEKGRLLILFDELQGFVEEDVGAVALVLRLNPVLH